MLSRAASTSPVRRFSHEVSDWLLTKHLTVRSFVLIGLLLSYIWRFHDLHPLLRPLRLAAVFSLSSWVMLGLTPNWRVFGHALQLPHIWLLLLWSLWMFLGLPFALFFERTWSFLTSDHIKSLALMLFCLGAAFRLRHVTLIAYVHVLGAFVLALFYAKGGFPTWGAPVPMYDVNDLALLLCISLPLAFYVATQSVRQPLRVGAWIVALLLALSIVATRSRGAFITFGVIVVLIMLRWQGIGLMKRIAPVALLVIGFMFASENARSRIATIFSIEQDYNLTAEEGRIAIWKRGMGYMMDNPVFGLGAGNFSAAEQAISGTRGMVAHNSYVEVGAETGLIGLLLFLSTFVFAIRELLRLRHRYRRLPQLAARAALCDAVFTSLVAWMVGAFFLAWGYSVILYTLFAMTAGLVISEKADRPLDFAGPASPRSDEGVTTRPR